MGGNVKHRLRSIRIDGDIEKGLKLLKLYLQRDEIIKKYKEHERYESPSERKHKKKVDWEYRKKQRVQSLRKKN